LTRVGVPLLSGGLALLMIVAIADREISRAGVLVAVIGLYSLAAGLYRQRRRRKDGQGDTTP
jgi:hypothetical protein